MAALQPVDHDLAGVDLDLGDEFDRDVHRLAEQIRPDDETDLEIGGIHRVVARDVDRGHGEVAVQWALAGRGIVLRSLWDVRALLASGQLLQVLPDVTQPANVWAVYPARLASSAKVRVCVDFLADEFALWNLPAP